jgi:tryptophan synthase alpha chain
MSRIQELFARKQSKVLNVYCTAGYPQLNSTITVMKSLQENGVDLVELGMPYSDPIGRWPCYPGKRQQSFGEWNDDLGFV